MADKKVKKMNDADVEKVAGGFVGTTGFSISHEIICPVCGESEEENFTTWIEQGTGPKDYFRCETCGNTFTVDEYGLYNT